MAVMTPQDAQQTSFTEAQAAVDRLIALYDRNIDFLRQNFAAFTKGQTDNARFRACYPQVTISVSSHSRIDNRLAFGFVANPGTYATTITRPRLYRNYLEEQLSLLIKSHNAPVQIGESTVPIPLHFSFFDGQNVDFMAAAMPDKPIADAFDVPDLFYMDDAIVNGTSEIAPGDVRPLAPFTAPRIDYSLHRLSHYTMTDPAHFQKFVIFTNYQFYVEEFLAHAQTLLRQAGSGYTGFAQPGGKTDKAAPDITLEPHPLPRQPQMPSYHLIRDDNCGITLINIGVGPSNAKTITDHVAVLRPHAWLMLGHCAGLRNSQSLGDYVLAHGYVREDHVLDDDLPLFTPIPPLAEIQVALERAIAAVTGYRDYDLKRIVRTGTVASIDNRNWELRDHRDPVRRLSQSRAVALDMESATIAANGFRFRVPYGTLLCVSDKPLHGELKLPGMATDFYKSQVAQHMRIGIETVEQLRAIPADRLHSRKLRSFMETAFQ